MLGSLLVWSVIPVARVTLRLLLLLLALLLLILLIA